MRSTVALALSLAWLPLAHAATTAPTATVDEMVARVQKVYEATRDLHARFDQEIETAAGRKRQASGDLWLKKPGKMRWEYRQPEKKLMIANGETLWVYEPEDQQAFKQDLRSSSLPSSVTFLFGAGKLQDEFTITRDAAPGLAGPGEMALRLVPKTPSAQVRTLVFVVDEKTALVKRTILHDQQGGVNRMTFSGIEINRGVDARKFAFTPPGGTRVLTP